MSGAWRRTFTLATPSNVEITVDYRMILGRGYEPEEFGRALLAINNTVLGNGLGSSLVHRDGDGDGGADDDTGWLSAAFTLALPAGEHALALGAYSNSASRTDEWTQVLFDNVIVAAAAAPSSYHIMVSADPGRSNPAPLQGQTVQGNIYVFTAPDTNVNQVSFWIDDPNRAGPRSILERRAPFDLAGTANDDSALPYDTRQLANGAHTVTVKMDLTDGTSTVITSNFSVGNAAGLAMVFDPTSASLNVTVGQYTSTTVNLATSSGEARPFSVTDDATWLTVTPGTGATPASLTLNV
jgi:hypothetical protein